MIKYQSDKCFFWAKMEGSVFPRAMMYAVPSAALTGLWAWIVHMEGSPLEKVLGEVTVKEDALMKDNAIWGGFSFLVGFLVVFRTSQAYSRFWEGCTSIHNMGAEWFDACSSLMAFCKHCPREKETEMLKFQHILIRLFSMLHATALGDIEDCSGSDLKQAFNFELIDGQAIDQESLRTIKASECKVELIFQWLQQLVVENIGKGVLTIPPPILTRSFQEMASGMVHFHNALKISVIPFPFPYAQTCDCMLLMHWMLVPFIVAQWVGHNWEIAPLYAFIQVFTLWSLNLIAVELDHPFGSDPNDIDARFMQTEMNKHLRLLIREDTIRTPELREYHEEPRERYREDFRHLYEGVIHQPDPDEPCDDPRCHSFTRIWQMSADMANVSVARRSSEAPPRLRNTARSTKSIARRPTDFSMLGRASTPPPRDSGNSSQTPTMSETPRSRWASDASEIGEVGGKGDELPPTALLDLPPTNGESGGQPVSQVKPSPVGKRVATPARPRLGLQVGTDGGDSHRQEALQSGHSMASHSIQRGSPDDRLRGLTGDSCADVEFRRSTSSSR